MTTADAINAGFELGAAVAMWVNVAKLLRDRKVAGVYWPVSAFYTVWGLWNIWFYATLGAPLSAWASWCVMLANATWVLLAIRYSRTAKTGWVEPPRQLPPAPCPNLPVHKKCQCKYPEQASDGFCYWCGGEGWW